MKITLPLPPPLQSVLELQSAAAAHCEKRATVLPRKQQRCVDVEA